MISPCRPFPAVVLALLFLASPIYAQEEVPELQQARAQHEKEVDFALRPLRDRYLLRLQGIKRSLASKGDVRAAVAVQDEIDLITAMSNETAILGRYVGSWVGDFKGDKRRFSVKTDNVVEMFNPGGALHATGRLVRRGKDFVFDWENIDQIDRVTMTDSGVTMELFTPKANFPRGEPTMRVPLTRTALSK